MTSIADLVFGPRRSGPAAPTWLRSRVLNATTLFAVQDRLRVYVDELEKQGQRFDPPGAEIRDNRTQAVVTRERLLEMHSYELREININGAGHGIYISTGPVRMFGFGPIVPDTIDAAIADIIEATSRPRVIWRRLWMLVPWLLAAAAVFVLVLGVSTHVGAVELLGLVVLTALAVFASGMGSVLIYRAVREYWPPTIVRPYRWRDIVARRATVWLTIAGAIGGAAAGAWVTWLVNRP